MHTKHTTEPTGSPVPGVIPEPVRVDPDTVAALERPAPGRRNPASRVLAKLLSAVRGDKYLADAYPPAAPRTKRVERL